MRILMDVDGVLADFVAACSRVLGRRIVPEQWQFIDKLSFTDEHLLKEELKKGSFWRSLTMINGAREGIRQLKKKHEIVYVTSPWVSCKEWGYWRREWLQKRFKTKNHEIVITNDKRHVFGDAIVDDRPENVRKYLGAYPGARGYLYEHPYNRNEVEFLPFRWDRIPEELR